MPKQTSHIFVTPDNHTLGYLLCLPDNYGADGNKSWPLIFFLHGRSERGTNLEMVKSNGIPSFVEDLTDFPFITVSPQCPAESRWIYITDLMADLLDDITRRFKVDQQRIYLTGLSMGGQGVWGFGSDYPNRFAAIAPICGRMCPTDITTLKDTPVWVFHGDNDPTVPYDDSVAMVQQLQAAGGNVRFTTYPNTGHNCWDQTYSNPELYEWFLRQKNSPNNEI